MAMLQIFFNRQLFLLPKVWVISNKFIFFMALTARMIKILNQNFSIIINIFWFRPFMQMTFVNLGDHLEIWRYRDSIVYFWSNHSACISTYMISSCLSELLFLIYLLICFITYLFILFLDFRLWCYFAF